MLKGVPAILSPQLLKVLCEMGHGDEIVIADGNFPAESMGKDAVVIRADGHGVPEILDAVLKMIPLDQYTENPAALMEVVPGDDCVPVIWEQYRALLEAAAYGARLSVETFAGGGVLVRQVTACGGIPRKNPLRGEEGGNGE